MSILSLLVSMSLLQGQNAKPNIVVIISDDLGIEIGAYGDTIARTPNIDKLAQEGIMFTRVWVTHSSCSSSRSSILTGLYPHQNGQIGLGHGGRPFHMYEDFPTFPHLLKENGYYTGAIGKIHVNGADGTEKSTLIVPYGLWRGLRLHPMMHVLISRRSKHHHWR